MKKRLLSVVLAVCLIISGLALFAGCSDNGGGGTEPPPDTAMEYAEWLLRNMKSSYKMSAWLKYEEDERYPYLGGESEEIGTSYTALVKNSGNDRVSTVYSATYDYNLPYQDRLISETKAEFIKSGENYEKKLYIDRKKSVVTTELTANAFADEASEFLLPEALLAVAIKGGEANITLRRNQAPDKYYEDGRWPSEEELKKFTILSFAGYSNYESNSDYTWFFLDFVVYENKLDVIMCQKSGKVNNVSYRHTGAISMNDIESGAEEPFRKTDYYASEEACATEMLNGVFDNQPERYRVAVTETVTMGTTTNPSHSYYIAYEKAGDTEYFYEKSTSAGEWRIEESYTRNGNGHIGRKYNTGDMTYREKVCDEHLCFYEGENLSETELYVGQHAYINVMNTSFLSMAQMLSAVQYAEVDFEGNVCTITINLPSGQEGVDEQVIFVIEGTVLKKFSVVQTIDSFPDISEMPDMPSIPGMPDLTGSTVITKTTSTFTYDTAAIGADLSGYTRAE